MTVFLDFETRSVADLKAVGLHNYARHPTTDVWCLCYAVDDGPVFTWCPGDAKPMWAHAPVEIVAHNAPFEHAIWNNVLVPRYGFSPLDPTRLVCTAARAYAMGLPGNLAGAAQALGLPVQKDSAGHALMLRMCRPRRYEDDGTPVWWDDPDKLDRLIAYCATDVEVERQLYYKLFPLSEYETRVWQADFAINARGLRVDRESVAAALKAVEAAKKELDKDMARVTGGVVPSCSALAALKTWIADQGVNVAGLAKADVVELLDEDGVPAAVRRALELRQEAGKASTAKLNVMTRIAGPDDRMRNVLQYHGAATGRWAGRAIQPHNFPREVPKAPVVEKMLGLLRMGLWRAVDMIYGPVLTIVSKCLRGFIVPAPGHVLIGGDFSSVEGRGVAWFGGEDWKIEAFKAADAGTGPGLYELAYAKSFHVPVESIKDPSFERQVGKVMELAFGYGGGKGAFRSMGKTFGIKVPEAQAELFKVNWRAAHPATKAVWRSLENAALAAARRPGEVFEAGHPGRVVRFKTAGTFLWCLLPSGRTLCYASPKILEGEYGPMLTYMTVPSTNDLRRGTLIDDPANTAQWARVSTYGGSLLENVIQAICRDLMADCILRCEAAGLPVVLHVHDEIVCEVPETGAEASRATLERIMNTVPAWAAGFPLRAKCHAMRRYGKG